jgi:hypothetical protein
MLSKNCLILVLLVLLSYDLQAKRTIMSKNIRMCFKNSKDCIGYHKKLSNIGFLTKQKLIFSGSCKKIDIDPVAECSSLLSGQFIGKFFFDKKFNIKIRKLNKKKELNFLSEQARQIIERPYFYEKIKESQLQKNMIEVTPILYGTPDGPEILSLSLTINSHHQEVSESDFLAEIIERRKQDTKIFIENEIKKTKDDFLCNLKNNNSAKPLLFEISISSFLKNEIKQLEFKKKSLVTYNLTGQLLTLPRDLSVSVDSPFSDTCHYRFNYQSKSIRRNKNLCFSTIRELIEFIRGRPKKNIRLTCHPALKNEELTYANIIDQANYFLGSVCSYTINFFARKGMFLLDPSYQNDVLKLKEYCFNLPVYQSWLTFDPFKQINDLDPSCFKIHLSGHYDWRFWKTTVYPIFLESFLKMQKAKKRPTGGIFKILRAPTKNDNPRIYINSLGVFDSNLEYQQRGKYVTAYFNINDWKDLIVLLNNIDQRITKEYIPQNTSFISAPYEVFLSLGLWKKHNLNKMISIRYGICNPKAAGGDTVSMYPFNEQTGLYDLTKPPITKHDERTESFPSQLELPSELKKYLFGKQGQSL